MSVAKVTANALYYFAVLKLHYSHFKKLILLLLIIIIIINLKVKLV